MLEIVFVVEESDAGGYNAYAVGQSIYTQADSLDELHAMVRDAVECHFEPDDGEKPQIIRLHFVRDEVLPLHAA
jgi:predicted RNase H-like HicB family nuclease